MSEVSTAMTQRNPLPGSIRSSIRPGGFAGFVLLYSQHYGDLLPAYSFASPVISIGRGSDCHVCIPEKAVSRHHASITSRDSAWTLNDLGGPNGTIVNGQYVREVVLGDGDEIRIGDTIFKFVDAEAEQYAGYRIDGAMIAGTRRQCIQATELVGGMQIDLICMRLERIAAAELSIVIQGESGTGKEVVARTIHELSRRRGPLQAVNCAAIPANLIESELFGYKRGAFSGADRDKAGVFAAANYGTLMLDEIGDMPLEAQAKLLRVLQSKEFYPVGATTSQKVDVRIVCATNRDLARLVGEGRFRGDLLARLNEFKLEVPALRRRKEDIYLLARTLLDRHGFSHVTLSFAFILALLHYDWPYNVRELEACLKRAAALAETNVLQARQLPDTIREVMAKYCEFPVAAGERTPPVPQAVATSSGARETPTEQELRQLLAEHDGNVAAVGRLFGKQRMQVHRWMRRYGIDPDQYRAGSTGDQK